ncbi:MAG: hypothetical protein BWZ02_03029 [Lentisphaerae bacterium ADurb.BinA184]|nr:MAG: hypothetical protein BWZ02_03029 [Lentisphaerae bacterium ADurb.BinA184]
MPAFQVIHRDEGLTELVLNLIADPRTLDQPRTIVFALEATPVKPLPPDFRRTLTGLGNTHTFTGGPGSYSHLVPAYKGSQRHPTGWDGAWTPDGNMVNSPFPADWDLNRFFNLELAKTGKLYLPYQTLNYTHLTRQLDPRTQGLEGPELWHIIGPEIECKGNGGWCMTPVHMQYRLYRYRDWIRHSSLRGFYFDNAYPILCADRGHGCGYALDDGRIQPTFTLFNMREFYKRLRTLIVAEGIEPCIMTHSTDTFMPAAYAFVDVMMDGETYRYRVPKETAPALAPPAPGATVADADVTAAAATDTDGLAAELIAAEAAATPEAREPATDPAPWRRYWSEYWPPEHFQVFGPPQHWGIMAVTMAYQKHGEEAPADQVARNGSAFLAYLLLHDTEYYLGASRGARLSQAGFDLAEEMRFLPYWEPETRRALHAPAPDVLVGGYQQGDLLLIVAFNRSRLPVRQLPVTVELGALGWGEAGARAGVVEFPKDMKDRGEALAAARRQVLAGGEGGTGGPAAGGGLAVTLDIEPHTFATATILCVPAERK